MFKNRGYLELSPEEISKAAKLTPKEKAAVDAFIVAALALPRGITISIEDDMGLQIWKKITRGSSHGVGQVKRRRLVS